ncbi:hypothetical protein [Sphingobium sp. LSP13-1-1.1]|uniref:hypothetical protein n=1 Tax=Sphingobium sp. LSP13-1-1.1 TaxID=3135234 RepID=UPI0034202AED
MRRLLFPLVAACALLSACGNVYNKALPDIEDEASINDIISDVDAQDKTLLRGYFIRKNNVRLGLIEAGPKEWNSATNVREAIEEQKLVRKHNDEQIKAAAEEVRRVKEEGDRMLAEIEKQQEELLKSL